MARRPVITITSAKHEIARARGWWRENRDKAPSAFDEDLERSILLIVDHPEIGAKIGGTRRPSARRLYLERLRYYLYYEVSDAAIFILALTHTARRRLPRL